MDCRISSFIMPLFIRKLPNKLNFPLHLPLEKGLLSARRKGLRLLWPSRVHKSAEEKRLIIGHDFGFELFMLVSRKRPLQLGWSWNCAGGVGLPHFGGLRVVGSLRPLRRENMNKVWGPLMRPPACRRPPCQWKLLTVADGLVSWLS